METYLVGPSVNSPGWFTGGAAATGRGAPEVELLRALAPESRPTTPKILDQLVVGKRGNAPTRTGWNVTEDLTTPDRRRPVRPSRLPAVPL